MQAVAVSHIWLDERGVPCIDGTNTKVIEVALDSTAYGWSADEMHEQHPHLSLSQIHAAMMHYHDHQGEFGGGILRVDREVDAMRTASGETRVERRLRMLGQIG